VAGHSGRAAGAELDVQRGEREQDGRGDSVPGP
jgi:hypothetical protein